MWRRFRVIVIICVMTMAALAADNSVGAWRMNFEKSGIPVSARSPRSVVLVYEPIDGGIKTTSKVEYSDGRTTSGGYTVKYDGKEYPTNLDGMVDLMSLRQIDANTFVIDERKKGGKRHQHGRKVISADGKTMTFTVEGTDDEGKPFKAVWVYDRQ